MHACMKRIFASVLFYYFCDALNISYLNISDNVLDERIVKVEQDVLLHIHRPQKKI